jgi:hypothetical protein
VIRLRAAESSSHFEESRATIESRVRSYGDEAQQVKCFQALL